MTLTWQFKDCHMLVTEPNLFVGGLYTCACVVREKCPPGLV